MPTDVTPGSGALSDLIDLIFGMADAAGAVKQAPSASRTAKSWRVFTALTRRIVTSTVAVGVARRATTLRYRCT
jgi:hypothetical protein